MILLNFAHPLTETQRTQIETVSGQSIAKLVNKSLQINEQQALAPQICALIDALDLRTEEWQGEPILINLPGYAPAAACLLAEVHGRMGHFPTIVYIRRQAGSTPPIYEVGEVLDLQTVRDDAREQRSSSAE